MVERRGPKALTIEAGITRLAAVTTLLAMAPTEASMRPETRAAGRRLERSVAWAEVARPLWISV